MKRIVFIIALSPIFLQAQQKDSTDLDPVEIRAIRAGAIAPFAKTNIYKKEIEQQNLGQDLPFLLNQTPSTVVHSDGGNGVGYTGIRIRGTDATRINITLNGIPYNDAESQGTFFVDLPDFASSLNSIQIQRGAGTSTNGAGAFGATINMSTHEKNSKSYLHFNKSFGSYNTWKNTLRAGTGLLNNHFTTDVRVSRISSDGYIDRAKSNLRSVYLSTAYLSDKTDVRINVFSGYEKTYQAWYGVAENDLKTNRRKNIAGTNKPGSPYKNEVDNYRQDHYQIFFTGRWHPSLVISTALFLTRGIGYYEQYKARQDYKDYNLSYPVAGPDTIFQSDLVRRLWLNNYYYGNIFSLIYEAQKSKITFGGAVTRYNGQHYGTIKWIEKSLASPNKWYDLDAYKTDVNLYTKWQQSLSSLFDVFAELQYRGVVYDLNGFRDHPALKSRNRYHFINPKLGLSYHKNNWLTYASWSKVSKEPNRDDFETGVLEKPRPEKLNDFEIGIEKKNSKFNWGANMYYMNYKDQLILTGKVNDVGAYTRINTPSSYRLGVELQANTILNKWLSAGGNLTFSSNKINNFTEYIDDYDNGGQKINQYDKINISFSPAITGAATITASFIKNCKLFAMGKYVGKQYLDNTSSDTRKLDAFFTQDVKAIYSLTGKALKNLEIIFQVYNVFNKKYEPNGYTFSYYLNNQLTTENFYFPMAGRNWMAGVNIKL